MEKIIFILKLYIKQCYQKMILYCLKCLEKTDIKNRKVLKIKKGKRMVLSNYAICDGKNLRLKSSGSLSNLGLRTLLSEISFCRSYFVIGILSH